MFGHKNFVMEIFVDADHVEKGLPGGKKKIRECEGVVVKMVGGPIFCRSKLQGVHAFKTQESEYMQLSEACKRGKIYLNLFQEIGMHDPKVDRPTIFEDNTAAGILASSNACVEQHIKTYRTASCNLQRADHGMKESV